MTGDSSKKKFPWAVILIIVVIIGLVVAVVAWWQATAPVSSSVTSGRTVTVALASPILGEDDPGWYCGTMGNRVCGLSKRAI